MAIPFDSIRDRSSNICFPDPSQGMESAGRRVHISDKEADFAAHVAVLDAPSLYLNSELSLLRFQRRVLEEARDSRNPLIERLKFLAILSSNLDEFFMVRVAGLLQQIESGVETLSIDGRPPGAQLEAIRNECIGLIEEAYNTYQALLLPDLAAAGIKIVAYRSLNSNQRKRLQTYFWESIYPVLTPLAFDRGRPFPHISNLSLNLAIVVRDPAGAEHFARVKVPDTIHQCSPKLQPRIARRHLCLGRGADLSQSPSSVPRPGDHRSPSVPRNA